MDVLRVGRISSINYEKGTARVTYPDRGGDTTPEIPFPSWFYWMPNVEDQVLVAHLPNGPAAAVILCPFWHDGNRPTEGFAGLYKREYAWEPGLAGERYDAESKDYNQSVTGNAFVSATESWTAQAGEESAAIQLRNDGTLTITAKKLVIKAPMLEFIDGVGVTSEQPMTVNAPQSLTVTSADSTFKGPVKVEGTERITGTLQADSNAVISGPVTAQSTITAQGAISTASGVTAAGNVAANGDVTASGISLRSHTHTAYHGETSGPH